MNGAPYDPTLHGADEPPGWSSLLHPDDTDRMRRRWEAAFDDPDAAWVRWRHLRMTPEAVALATPSSGVGYAVKVDHRRDRWWDEHRDRFDEQRGTLRTALHFGMSDDPDEIVRDVAAMLYDTGLFDGPAPTAESVAARLASRVLEAEGRGRLATAVRRATDADQVRQMRAWAKPVLTEWDGAFGAERSSSLLNTLERIAEWEAAGRTPQGVAAESEAADRRG